MRPTQRHWKFAELVAQGVDKKNAALQAGFSERTADKKAWIWVGHSRSESKYPELFDYVEAIRKKAMDEAVAKTQELLEFLTNVIRTNISDVIEFDGFGSKPKAFEDMPDSVKASIKKFKFRKGDGTEIEMYSKMDAVEKLMKFHGAYEKDNEQRKGDVFTVKVLGTKHKKDGD